PEYFPAAVHLPRADLGELPFAAPPPETAAGRDNVPAVRRERRPRRNPFVPPQPRDLAVRDHVPDLEFTGDHVRPRTAPPFAQPPARVSGDVPTVRTPEEGRNGVIVGDGHQFPARRHVPHFHHLVAPARGQSAAVRGKGQAGHAVRVARE